MSDVLESIGRAAAPAEPALDLFLPDPQPQGRITFGSLIRDAGKGVVDLAKEGPGAVAGGLYAAADPGSGLSARDRLLVGGLAAVGGGIAGRQLHSAWKASLGRDVLWKGAPSGYSELVDELGDRPRFIGDISPEGSATQQQYPGIHPRQAEILGATDYDGVMRGIGRWEPDDSVADAHGRQWFDIYVNEVGDQATAQVDWAKFDHAIDRGLLKYDHNKPIRDLWRKLTTRPQDFTPNEADELFGTVRALSEATDHAGNDLTVGIVGRIERVDVTDSGVIAYTRHPVGWTDGSAADPLVRADRVRQLNYRNLADRGKHMLRRLYQIGATEYENLQAGGTPRLLGGEGVSLGPDWYYRARADVAKTFGLAPDDTEDLQRAVASVSFLSEAEDWSNNIPKAHRILTEKSVANHLADDDFLAWLREPAAFTGRRAKKFEKDFEEIHELFRDGFSVSAHDMRVVLRLMGAQESVFDIFASTGRRKQKNFFLNILEPDLEFPVTVDRHAFDAFLGLDTGLDVKVGTLTAKRPIDVSLGADDTVYDVIADTYRGVAAELGIRPHQLQAVVWETWRSLKADPYTGPQGRIIGRRNGWSTNDPFMLPEEDGSTNAVYEALNGRGYSAFPDSEGPLPADVLRAGDARDLEAAALPDGSVAYVAEASDEAVSKFRHLYPAVNGADGVPRWAPIRPTPVQSVQQVRATLAGTRGVGRSNLSVELERAGGHPVQTGRESVVLELDDRVKIPKGDWTIRRIGRTTSDEQVLGVERQGLEDLDPITFRDHERSPLTQNQFAVLTAENPGGAQLTAAQNRKRNNKLVSELTKRGHKPIPVEGRYGGADEASFLVIGMGADEAAELGRRFEQESVLIPQGLLFTDGSDTFMPQTGLEFDLPIDGDFRSIVDIGDDRVSFAFDFDFDSDPLPFVPEEVFSGRTTRTRRQYVVPLPERSQYDVVQLAEQLEAFGGRNISIYTNRPNIDGWERGVDSVYSDGVETYTVRSRDADITSPNSGYVFARSIDGALDRPPAVPANLGVDEVGDQLAFDGQRFFPFEEEVPPGALAAYRNGRVEALDETNVLPAIEAKALLETHGVEVRDLRVEGAKPYGFTKQPQRVRKDTVSLKNGTLVPYVRHDAPLPDWAEDFGFSLDPAFRVGNEVQRLPDSVVQALRELTEELDPMYGDALRRFRLAGVSVTPGREGLHQYAFTEWRAGGYVGLAKEWWSDVPAMTRQLEADRASGFLARGADASPASLLAHEYGHVVHGALRLSQSGKLSRTSHWDRKLRKLVGVYGEGSFARGAGQISETARVDTGELIAEAFSETFTGTPSTVSRAVVGLVDEWLEEALRFRRLAGL